MWLRGEHPAQFHLPLTPPPTTLKEKTVDKAAAKRKAHLCYIQENKKVKKKKQKQTEKDRNGEKCKHIAQ